MKRISVLSCIGLIFLNYSTFSQVTKGQIGDENEHRGHVLPANSMELVNKYYPSLNFEYSFNKTNWKSFNLKRDEYMLVEFTIDENYCFVKICSDSPVGQNPNCQEYRLKRRERYEFKWSEQDKEYIVNLVSGDSDQ